MSEHVTGYYVRAKRDGKFQSIDIALLNQREIKEFFEGATPDRIISFVVALTAWIRENRLPKL